MRKFTYTLVWWGMRADQKLRDHSRSSSKPSAVSLTAVMLNVWPAPRPLKAVWSSSTRATAPHICQIGKVVSGERICIECSTVMSMMSFVSSAVSQARM